MIPQNLVLAAGSAIIVACFGLAGEGVSRLIRRVGRRAGLRESTLIATRDTARAIWIVLAIVGVAYYTHLASELTLLAVSTVGGLILSLALQATLSNVIAGIFMLEDGTLRLDDDITYSSVTGRVVRITLRSTWILTDKGVIAAVANSQLMNGPLLNRTATARLARRYRLGGEMTPPATAAPDTESSRPPAAAKPPEQGTVRPPEKGAKKGSEPDGT
ncbi:MAG: mechanosensitive ion channel family protein [Thermoplasmata archaeon]